MSQNRLRKKNKKLLDKEKLSKNPIRKANKNVHTSTEVNTKTAKKVNTNATNRFGLVVNSLTSILARLKFIGKVPTLIWLIISVVAAGLVFYSYNSVTSGIYSSNNSIEIQFDHRPNIDKIAPGLELAGISEYDYQTQGGNSLIITTNAEPEEITQFLGTLETDQSVLNSGSYSYLPLNPVQTYLPGFLLTTIILISGITTIAAILLRKRGRSYGLKLSFYASALFLTGVIVTSAIGLIFSLVGIFKLNEYSLNLYFASLLIQLVILVYISTQQELREEFFRRLRLDL